MDWHAALAPSLDDFAALAADELARLPATFRDICAGLVMRIEDFASDEVLADLGLESPFDLMGLYQGIDFATQEGHAPPSLPPMIFLYRRAILDYWADGEDSLGGLVRHVLVHEIGHHFGLSDEAMEAIENAVATE